MIYRNHNNKYIIIPITIKLHLILGLHRSRSKLFKQLRNRYGEDPYVREHLTTTQNEVNSKVGHKNPTDKT